MNIKLKASLKAIRDMALVFGAIAVVFMLVGLVMVTPYVGIVVLSLTILGLIFWIFYDMHKHDIEMTQKQRLDELFWKKKSEIK